MRLLFVIDEPETLNAKKDSSIALMRAAIARGDDVYTATIQSFVATGDGVGVLARRTQVCDGEPWHKSGEEMLRGGEHFGAVMMRKEPPVNGAFVEATLLMEKMQAPVYNSPRALREKNEKLAILDFPDLIPPTIVASDIETIAAFHAEHKGAVLKPLDGMGGRGVLALGAGDLNVRAAASMLSGDEGRLIMAQQYIPEAKDGDRRVFVINGEPAEIMLARIPKPGDHRSNMAAGGTPEARPLGEAEAKVARAVAPALAADGVLFAGLDIIGGKLTEINITCPTGLQEVKTQTGKDLAADILAAVEKLQS